MLRTTWQDQAPREGDALVQQPGVVCKKQKPKHVNKMSRIQIDK
jgi:hypothetical protein